MSQLPSSSRINLFSLHKVSILICFSFAILLAVYWYDSRQRDRVPARLAARGESIPLLVKCREQPLHVSPNPGLENAVREEDLVVALCAALPWWNPPSVPSAFHELKLWGRKAIFTKDMFGTERTGESLIATLTNDKLCRANTAQVGSSYLLDSPFGIRPVLVGSVDAVEYRGEAHYGQLLAILGEVGVNSDTPVTSSSGHVGSIADLYQDALLGFSEGHELEFIACTLAYWHPPQISWKDRFNNEHTFDHIVSRLIEKPFGQGACGGCHVPYAIVIILRIDESYPILSDGIRVKARNWLTLLSGLLESSCSASGGWDKSWSQNSEVKLALADDALDEITITGHHLEWISLAPNDLRPAELRVKRAALGIRKCIDSLPPIGRQSFKTLLPVSHAARALALIRCEDPYSLWLKYWKNGKLKLSKQGFTVI